jgi:GNAT superfamily N-acetyltransferase
MAIVSRTTPGHHHFKQLVADLDAELWLRYPAIQQNFAPYNKIDQSARVVIAYLDDQPVGCGCFRPMDDPGCIEMKRMYVMPAVRGRGIAKLILDELERWAIGEGFSNSKLETGFNQPEAVAVYRRCGYEVIPNYPPYTDMKESMCMAKILGTAPLV